MDTWTVDAWPAGAEPAHRAPDRHVAYEDITAARRATAGYREGDDEARRAFLIGQAIRQRRLTWGCPRVTPPPASPEATPDASQTATSTAWPTSLRLSRELDAATQQAVDGLRAFGYSWGDIAARLGTTRQAAQQRGAGSDQQPLPFVTLQAPLRSCQSSVGARSRFRWPRLRWPRPRGGPLLRQRGLATRGAREHSRRSRPVHSGEEHGRPRAPCRRPSGSRRGPDGAPPDPVLGRGVSPGRCRPNE